MATTAVLTKPLIAFSTIPVISLQILQS